MKTARFEPLPDTAALKQKIQALIEESDRKLSPGAIENILLSDCALPRRTIRNALHSLIADGELEYTYAFGSSYVETSFNRPVRISDAVVVKPFNMTYPAKPTDIVIDIFPGVSFGSGTHPTTRLSVRGIEYALKDRRLIHDFKDTAILDIGTGSGILAICAMKFGIETGIGVDTDPCSINEAKKNAQINHLEDRLYISKPVVFRDQKFSMIAANLRFPDIMTIFPVIAEHSAPLAPVVLSGLRPEETEPVLSLYAENHFQCLSVSEEKNWSCLVLQKLSGDLFHP
jgi:ribosomal protein L11 methyltransferase